MGIDYKELHNLLARRKREIKELSLESEEYAGEYKEIENMMISVRNLYKRVLGIPVRWEIGDPHPILQRARWEAKKRLTD